MPNRTLKILSHNKDQKRVLEKHRIVLKRTINAGARNKRSKPIQL